MDMAYWVPDVDPTGAGVGMLSYCGQVRMTIMVDAGNSATAAEVNDDYLVLVSCARILKGIIALWHHLAYGVRFTI